MKYLNAIVRLIRANIRFFFMKIFHPKNFSYKMKSLVSSSSHFEITKGGEMRLGKKLLVGKRCEIRVRKHGYLILKNGVGIGNDCDIVCHERIEIGENTIIAPKVMLYDHDHIFDANLGVKKKEFKTAPIKIGKNCWIGANTMILRGTTIGDNCVIGAGCVLKGTYPDGSVIIQKRETIVK